MKTSTARGTHHVIITRRKGIIYATGPDVGSYKRCREDSIEYKNVGFKIIIKNRGNKYGKTYWFEARKDLTKGKRKYNIGVEKK